MDKLEFIIFPTQKNTAPKKIGIFINDKSIIDVLREFEKPYAKKEGSESIAGNYDWLTPGVLLNYLTNPAEYDFYEDQKVSILDCPCGCGGCWPMIIKIVESTNKIIWMNFEQPHRNKQSHTYWDYSDFGSLEFNKVEYKKQLQLLSNPSNL